MLLVHGNVSLVGCETCSVFGGVEWSRGLTGRGAVVEAQR